MLTSLSFLPLLCASAAAPPFEEMQIEMIIGGVNGDPTAQAIQLRMRSPGQNLVSNARLVVRDATGGGPVTIVDFSSDVASALTGDRVLITSAAFDPLTAPPAVPDFTMTSLIPLSYLAAGTLVYESDAGDVYWRLSWGGVAYTGTHAGETTNDADGNFGEAYQGAPPVICTSGLEFQGSAIAMSLANRVDYAFTGNPATVFNNSGAFFTLAGTPPDCPGTSFCFGIGCPCANDDPSAGCINSTGSGAFLTGFGTNSASADDLVLIATSCPPLNSGLYFAGTVQLMPRPFVGDGLGCAGGNAFRYFPSTVDAFGVFVKTNPVTTAPPGFITPGESYNFQAWTRDVLCGPPPNPCVTPCGGGSNLSNAYNVTFVP